MSRLLLLLLALCLVGERTQAQSGRDAFSQFMPGLSDVDDPALAAGKLLFRHAWSPGPYLLSGRPPGEDGAGRAMDGARALVRSGFAEEPGFNGLGPTYNRLSCAACHIKNGRGFPPENGREPLQGMLIRLSVPGQSPHGGPLPHPAYGDQLNDHAMPGVPAEGRGFIDWQPETVRLGDGSVVPMRRPVLRITDLAFGPLGAEVMTSLRVGPAVFGMGLLEAVPEATLRQIASQQNGPVHGQPNHVWDQAAGRIVIGRFGLKANQPNLRQQIAAAFIGDLGVTSTLYPAPNCPAVQTACRNAQEGPQPELTDQQLEALSDYLRGLEPPAPRPLDTPARQRGAAQFAALGCPICHMPELTTDDHAPLPQLARRHFAPYSDLLLHDLGADLADGRPDFQASGRHWRTAPLWGLGLAAQIADRVSYLHDGRALSLIEAILWHGGEAQAARDRFAALDAIARAELIAFLNTL